MNKISFGAFFAWEGVLILCKFYSQACHKKTDTDFFFKILWNVRLVSANNTRVAARPLKYLYAIYKQKG